MLVFYFIQLALNAVWTPIFFGAYELGWVTFAAFLNFTLWRMNATRNAPCSRGGASCRSVLPSPRPSDRG
ncbi:MAG: hypothetical protein IZT59_13390 [Verrucomicrobia bacterium]|nr:hypothetical protein [Verrucomicrobiota bacterium]